MHPRSSSIVLPVSKTPRIRSVNNQCFPVAILETIPTADDWILSNFIQLTYAKRVNPPVTFHFYVNDWTRNPWLETIRLNTRWVRDNVSDVAQFLSDQVAQGFYCYVLLNERYIPDRTSFGTDEDFIHDILVYGFDREKEIFHLLGYDQEMRFRSTTAGFSDVAKAWISQDHHNDNNFVLLRAKNDTDYPIRASEIKRDLGEFLDGTNTSERYSESMAPLDNHWGVDVYPALEAEYHRFLRGEMSLDIRGPRVLIEHKRLMRERTSRLLPEREAAAVDAVGREVEAYFWRLMTSATEVVVNGRTSRFERCVYELPAVVDKEVDWLTQLHEAL